MSSIRPSLLLLLAPLLALAGCDSARLARLHVGESTEADVCAQFGRPDEVFILPGGARQLEFTRQPEGTTTYMLTIGADGRLRAVTQVLQPAQFARIKPGLSHAEVRQLLGRPARQQHLARPNQDLWQWRWQDGRENRMFDVTFDAQARVVSAGPSDDLRNKL